MPRLIDAEELKERSHTVREFMRNMPDLYVVSLRQINRMPTIDAEPVRHGRWEYHPNASAGGNDVWTCSECGVGYSWVEGYNYCANCGAKMDEEG